MSAEEQADRSPRGSGDAQEPIERPASPASHASADGGAPASADKKKWTRGEEEKVGDEFSMKMSDGPKKAKATSWNETRSADDKATLGANASTILGALMNRPRGHFEGDYREASAAADTAARGKHLVNILAFNHSDREVDYGEIFGDDIADTPGLRVWVIEGWKVKAVDEEDFGKFHTEDCYLVLHVSEVKRSKQRNVHLWIGKGASQDKAAAVSIRGVMLCNYLQGQAKQHREDEGKESDEFISYFFAHDGMQQLDGSAVAEDTALKPPAAVTYETALYLVCPFSTPRLRRVELSLESLHSKDVLILDLGLTIYQWNGARSLRATRFKAMEFCRRINDWQRHGNARIAVVEQDAEEDDFILALTSGEGAGGAVPDGDLKMRMFKINESAEAKEDKVKLVEPPLSRRHLDPTHTVVLDAFSEVFIWTGRFCSTREKQIAALLAGRFMKMEQDPPRPAWAAVHKIRQGAEPLTFRAKFADWRDVLPLGNYSRPPPRPLALAPAAAQGAPTPAAAGVAAEKSEVDVEKLYDSREWPADTMIDDARGVTELWNLERSGPKFVKLPGSERGIFHTGDCYLVLYTYYDERDFNAQKYIAYFWEGAESNAKWFPSFLFGFYPLLQRKMAVGKGPANRLRYVRVREGLEPAHFMALFKGNLVVRRGRRRNRAAEEEQVQLFDVKAADEERARCVQVPAAAANLHSRDCFILLTPTRCFLWNGFRCRAHTRAAAQVFVEMLNGGSSRGEALVQDEELEEDEFWAALGPKQPYADTNAWEKNETADPRLFHISQSSGRLRVEELQHVAQSQLTDEDVFWLDCFTDLYVWFGANTRGSLRVAALHHANAYAKFAASIRDAPVPVVEVRSGEETAPFTWQFHAWRARPARRDPRTERLKALNQEALEDRQIEQADVNLAREERWELREGEFDDRPFVASAAPFDADLPFEMEQQADGEWRVELVLGPGRHHYQFEVDAGEWEADARRPTEQLEGVGTVNRLTVRSRDPAARPCQYTLTWRQPPPPAEGEAPPAPISVRVRGFAASTLLSTWQAEHAA